MTNALGNFEPEHRAANAEFKAQVLETAKTTKLGGEDVSDVIASTLFERWSIYCFESVSSTMDIAACLGQTQSPEIFSGAWLEGSGAASGGESLVIAQTQTKGRGRDGRGWYSEPNSGLYLSYLFYPDSPAEKLTGFSLAIGVALWESVTTLGADCTLKWPNDVLAREHSEAPLRKLAGILLESASAGEQVTSVRAGIGLNVAQLSFPETIPGISLAQLLLEPPDYFAVLGLVAGKISEAAAFYFDQGFGAFRGRWEQAALVREKPIHVAFRHPGTRETVKGVVKGVNADGALLVKSTGSDEEAIVFSGEVEWEDAPRY